MYEIEIWGRRLKDKRGKAYPSLKDMEDDPEPVLLNSVPEDGDNPTVLGRAIYNALFSCDELIVKLIKK